MTVNPATTTPTPTAIAQRIEPVDHLLGPIAIRRLLPAAERQMVGPFIFFDHGGPFERDSMPPGAGVPEHPHAGLATFSYLMHGTVHHRDSAGHRAAIQSGDIALMTAGSGITHEEIPQPGDSPRHMFAQLWLALPDEYEETVPGFEHHHQNDLPLIDFDRATARLTMGTGWGETAPTTSYSDTIFAELNIDAGGQLPVPASWDERALFLMEGDASIEGVGLKPFEVTILKPEVDIELASPGGARLLLLGGGTFPSRRHIAGSFVGSSPEKITNWMQAWQTGDFPRIG